MVVDANQRLSSTVTLWYLSSLPNDVSNANFLCGYKTPQLFYRCVSLTLYGNSKEIWAFVFSLLRLSNVWFYDVWWYFTLCIFALNDMNYKFELEKVTWKKGVNWTRLLGQYVAYHDGGFGLVWFYFLINISVLKQSHDDWPIRCMQFSNTNTY